MFTGLTVANIIGVPLTTLLGQQVSWRVAFGLVAVIGALAAVAVAVIVPGESRDARGERRPRAHVTPSPSGHARDVPRPHGAAG